MTKNLTIKNSTAEFLIFTTQAGKDNINVRIEGETVWLTQKLIAQLFECSVDRDLCINMNNHQNAIFHQITNFLKTPLALLGVDLKNFQFNKICHFANHPYLCKGLR